MTRETSTVTNLLAAECHGCDWQTNAANTFGTAARHHDATGHPITVTINRTITYGNPNAPLPDQLALDSPTTPPS